MKWFRHDADMLRNRKIRKLIRSHGATGYAFWCALLEKLYSTEESFQIDADDLWIEDIAEDLKLGDDRTPIRILDSLAELGLIDAQLWQDKLIYSPSIAKRGDQYIQKRTYEREKKRKQRLAKKVAKQTKTIDVPRDMKGTVPRGHFGTKGQTPDLSPSDTDPKTDLDPKREKTRAIAAQVQSATFLSQERFSSLEPVAAIAPEQPLELQDFGLPKPQGQDLALADQIAKQGKISAAATGMQILIHSEQAFDETDGDRREVIPPELDAHSAILWLRARQTASMPLPTPWYDREPSSGQQRLVPWMQQYVSQKGLDLARIKGWLRKASRDPELNQQAHDMYYEAREFLRSSLDIQDFIDGEGGTTDEAIADCDCPICDSEGTVLLEMEGWKTCLCDRGRYAQKSSNYPSMSRETYQYLLNREMELDNEF